MNTKEMLRDHFDKEDLNNQEFCSDNDEAYDYRNYCSNRYGRNYNYKTGKLRKNQLNN